MLQESTIFLFSSSSPNRICVRVQKTVCKPTFAKLAFVRAAKVTFFFVILSWQFSARVDKRTWHSALLNNRVAHARRHVRPRYRDQLCFREKKKRENPRGCAFAKGKLFVPCGYAESLIFIFVCNLKFVGELLKIMFSRVKFNLYDTFFCDYFCGCLE